MPDTKLNFTNASNANQTIIVFAAVPEGPFSATAWQVLQVGGNGGTAETIYPGQYQVATGSPGAREIGEPDCIRNTDLGLQWVYQKYGRDGSLQQMGSAGPGNIQINNNCQDAIWAGIAKDDRPLLVSPYVQSNSGFVVRPEAKICFGVANSIAPGTLIQRNDVPNVVEVDLTGASSVNATLKSEGGNLTWQIDKR